MPKSHLDWLAVATLWLGAALFAFKSASFPLMAGAPGFLASGIWDVAPAALISAALMIYLFRLLRPVPAVSEGQPQESLLELRFYGDDRAPTGIILNNIWRWYILSIIKDEIRDGIRQPPERTGEILFIVFDNNTVTRNLSISSPDMRVPRHEVKDFGMRHAVISFSEPIPPGTLIVRAH